MGIHLEIWQSPTDFNFTYFIIHIIDVRKTLTILEQQCKSILLAMYFTMFELFEAHRVQCTTEFDDLNHNNA